MHKWRVVPLSPGQMLDVRPEDVLGDGLYRRCSTQRGGGGYDQFPSMARHFLGWLEEPPEEQFIAQLHGCNLDCPYCYVTREGVWGSWREVTSTELVRAYRTSGLPVMHLMGGAPALQMAYWPELLMLLDITGPYIFHSDMMLTERSYREDILVELNRYDAVFAVNIKGTNEEEWQANTRRPWPQELFWDNFRLVQRRLRRWYLTFTGCEPDGIELFIDQAVQNGVYLDNVPQYSIPIIDYNALPHVDDVPWGRQERDHDNH